MLPAKPHGKIPTLFWSIILPESEFRLEVSLRKIFRVRTAQWNGHRSLTPSSSSIMAFWVLHPQELHRYGQPQRINVSPRISSHYGAERSHCWERHHFLLRIYFDIVAIELCNVGPHKRYCCGQIWWQILSRPFPKWNIVHITTRYYTINTILTMNTDIIQPYPT